MCVRDKWEGGGRPGAGIHSICRNPNDPNHAYVAISCAGVIETKDGGQSWTYVNKGMSKVFDPGDDQDFGHDPHCVHIVPGPARGHVASQPLWNVSHDERRAVMGRPVGQAVDLLRLPGGGSSLEAERGLDRADGQ